MSSNQAEPFSRRPLTKRALLLALKAAEGGAPCQELARATGISMSGTRATLVALLADGLVRRTAIRKGQGRPAWSYEITMEGARRCSSTESPVSVELLEVVRRLAPDVVRMAVEERFTRRAAKAKLAIGEGTAHEQVRQVCAQLRDEGYIVDARPQRGSEFVLSITHCPVLDVAQTEPSVCLAEERYLSSVLADVSVSSVANMTRGSGVCAYEIREQPA